MNHSLEKIRTVFLEYKTKLIHWARTLTWAQILKGVGLLIGFGITCIFILNLLILIGVFGKIPGKPQFAEIKNPLASLIYGEGDQIIGKYFIENRTNVTFEEISPQVIQALIATEDERFYAHRGIDWRSWGRVLVKTILLQKRSSGGGSTISQQLAKNLYPRKNYWILSLPINKFREIWIAHRLEKYFTKEDILTLYLNTVSFGGTTYGIKTAARQLFAKGPENLRSEEAALLIGMLKATNFYHPVKNEERARNRRNIVLNQMHRVGYLDSIALDSLLAVPMQIDYQLEGSNAGLATYFREYLRLQLKPILEDIKNQEGKPYNLYTDGLKVYTTIDPQMQQIAEKSVNRHLKRLQKEFDLHWKNKSPWLTKDNLMLEIKKTKRYQKYKSLNYSQGDIDSLFRIKKPMKIFTWEGEEEVLMSPLDSVKHYFSLLHTGFLVVDHQNGAIKAWVGGIDHSRFKYDHVISRRQAGSVFKPIVYARALEIGYAPCDYFDNVLMTYPEYDDWTPQNASANYGGMYSLMGGMIKSINTVTVGIGLEGEIDSIRQLAHKMGIQSDIPRVPSIFLGTAEVSLLEMVQAYQTLANHGQKIPLQYLVKIENHQGEIIYENPEIIPEPVYNSELAGVMTHMLKNTTIRGTAHHLKDSWKLSGDMAGKTGTTQSHADGWYLGYTPRLVAGCWIGGESPLVRFRTIDKGQGAHTAMPVWAHFFNTLYRYRKYREWSQESFDPLDDQWLGMLDCPDYIEDYEPFHWQEILNELFVQQGDKDHENSRKPSRRRRSRHSVKEKKLEKFFENLFRKKKKNRGD